MNIQEKIEREERQDVEAVLSTVAGRRFLWRVLSQAGIYKDIPTQNPEQMARQLGKRALGLWLLQIVGEAGEDQLFTMMKEAKARVKELELMAKRAGVDDSEISAIPSGMNLI